MFVWSVTSSELAPKRTIPSFHLPVKRIEKVVEEMLKFCLGSREMTALVPISMRIQHC